MAEFMKQPCEPKPPPAAQKVSTAAMRKALQGVLGSKSEVEAALAKLERQGVIETETIVFHGKLAGYVAHRNAPCDPFHYDLRFSCDGQPDARLLDREFINRSRFKVTIEVTEHQG